MGKVIARGVMIYIAEKKVMSVSNAIFPQRQTPQGYEILLAESLISISVWNQLLNRHSWASYDTGVRACVHVCAHGPRLHAGIVLASSHRLTSCHTINPLHQQYKPAFCPREEKGRGCVPRRVEESCGNENEQNLVRRD